MKLSFCIPYYRNPLMLAEHYRIWRAYPEPLKNQIEVVLVDDGSPEADAALAVPRPSDLPRLRIYRVLEDRPWRCDGARNLAAHEATGVWLLLTDMDHAMPARSLELLLARTDQDRVYTFHRVRADTELPVRDALGNLKPHQNTYAMTRARFWRLGGYDEDMTGWGTDGYFIRLLKGDSAPVHLEDAPLHLYTPDLVSDSMTIGLDRVKHKAENDRLRHWKKERGIGPTILKYPYRRVL